MRLLFKLCSCPIKKRPPPLCPVPLHRRGLLRLVPVPVHRRGLLRLVPVPVHRRGLLRLVLARRRRLLALLATACVALVLVQPGFVWASDGTGGVFRPPVEAPVADPFRAPEHDYGPGNRGIEYDTDHGDVVRAAAAGTVVFAGPVAGSLHVTVDHGGGVVSSYSYLARISVRVGASVQRGTVVGIAAQRLHFGVRVDDEYVDPAGFIGVRRVKVRLVPLRSRPHWR